MSFNESNYKSHFGVLYEEKNHPNDNCCNSTNYLELQEVFLIVESQIISKWQKEFGIDIKGLHYKSTCPVINPWILVGQRKIGESKIILMKDFF